MGIAKIVLFVAAMTLLGNPAVAVPIGNDDAFVLDFVANGDGSGGLSKFEVAVYWKWDGGDTLGIRMESPDTDIGLSGDWSFNIFSGASSPGGLDNTGSNTLSISNLSIGGAFSEASLGAYGVAVDAIEATWTQPSSGGAFDPSLSAFYIQLTIFSTNSPGTDYRMADYLGGGGTYSNSPDIFNPMDGSFCATPNGSCAELTFVPEPSTALLLAGGLLALAAHGRRRKA